MGGVVEKGIEAVQNAPALLEFIKGLLDSGYTWVVIAVLGAGFAALFVWLLTRDGAIRAFELAHRTSARKLKRLERYLARGELSDPAVAETVRDVRDAEYFRLATGIRAEKKLRDALIQLNRETSSKVEWAVIRSAMEFIAVGDDGRVVVRPADIGDRILDFIALVLTAASVVMFLICNVMTFVAVIVRAPELWQLAGFTVVSFGLMFIFVHRSQPMRAANRIRNELRAAANAGTAPEPEPQDAPA